MAIYNDLLSKAIVSFGGIGIGGGWVIPMCGECPLNIGMALWLIQRRFFRVYFALTISYARLTSA